MALAGCQLLGGLEAKELVTADADAGGPGGETDAGETGDGSSDEAATVACGAAPVLDDVPNGVPPPDSRAKASWKVDRASGTIFDTLTGLTWIDAPLAARTFDDATCACAALRKAGFSDFRLASRYELIGILDYDRVIPEVDGPAIDTSIFRDVALDYYWTSTRYASSNPAQVAVPWLVGIGDGRAVGATQTGKTKGPAWCVRGGTAKVGARFEAKTETVRDAYTGLVWQRTLPVQTWPRLLTPEVDAACAALTLDGATGFRVPTVKELQTLVIAGKRDLAIDETVFPDTGTKLFHARPHYADPSSTNNWDVDFVDGKAYPNSGSQEMNVRCVRKP
jgi:hypothetical protein